jgi:N4-gp56 family major capsid protein
MPETRTLLTNMINPQVMSDIISGELASKIKVAPLAKIDNTLEGRAGNTITVPVYAFIGEAADLADVEGATTVLSASSTTATVKKAFKAVEITDEALNSGFGDPLGEAGKQLALSLAGKVDTDAHAALTAIASGKTYDGTAAIIGYTPVVNAIDLYEDEEQGEAMYLIIHPKQLTQLRLDSKFTPASEMGDRVIESGVVGMIAGCKVLLSKKIATAYVSGTSGAKKYVNFIVKPGALTIYVKREVDVETDRNIKTKTTILAADMHYTVVLSDASKAVKMEVLEVTASAG